MITSKVIALNDKLMRLTSLLLLLALSLSSCIEMQNTYEELPPGVWRGVLFLDSDIRDLSTETSKSIHQIRDKELPINFEIFYDDDGEMYAEFINGEERIRTDEISYTRVKRGGKDSIRIDFPLYNSYISALFMERYMSGKFYDLNRGVYSIPFKAQHGEDYRFMDDRTGDFTDFSGSWQVMFDQDTDSPYKAMGHFEQNGNVLTGTFKTETGDFRYLQGNVVDDQMFLSVFDGSHAFLFRAQMQDDGKLVGVFRSGKHYSASWVAERSDSSFLASAMDLTYLKEGYETLDFSFKTPQGDELSPSSASSEGKAKLIQIFGTWCPNCKDETIFLRDYIKENPQEDLVILGLAFEKQKDARADAAIALYKEKLEIPWDVAVAGSYRKSEAAKSLPALNAIISYPTLIFMDSDNRVKHIHTGFNGPATDEYEQWKTKFDQMLKDILP